MDTPVLLLVFNRPGHVRRVFSRVREAKPSRLYVAADGPRPGRTGEADACREAREAAAGVDWPCEVRTLYREGNLGCRLAVSGALDWFFSNEDEGIVLEDDCVPSPSFFRYCRELLERFRGEERVMSVSGVNFQFGRGPSEFSYYFSRYNHCWGWASWRRAWARYDGQMADWPDLKGSGFLRQVFETPYEADYWTRAFDKAYRGEVDSWAYRWTLSMWRNGGLATLPEVNLVSNIGFGQADATHTGSDSHLSRVPVCDLAFPLHHPPRIERDRAADRRTFRTCFDQRLYARLVNRARRALRSFAAPRP